MATYFTNIQHQTKISDSFHGVLAKAVAMELTFTFSHLADALIQSDLQ